MFVRKTLHFPLSAALFLSLIGSATAQSLKVNAPAHLAAGVNHATVDSFVGDHYWDFYVNPGKFQLVFAGSDPEEGFSVGGAPPRLPSPLCLRLPAQSLHSAPPAAEEWSSQAPYRNARASV